MILEKLKREVYTKERRERAQRLVLEYQKNRTSENAEKVIEEFISFIYKYYRLICFSFINASDPDIRHFVTLFSKDIKKYKKFDTRNFRLYDELAKEIHNRCKQLASNEEWLVTLKILFLQACKNYKPMPNVSFTGYIYNYYRYIVKNYISTAWASMKFDAGVEVDKINDGQEMSINREINMKWVRGDCDEIFSILTENERSILKMKYNDKLCEKEIARLLLLKTSTVRNKIKAIKEKIMNYKLKEQEQISKVFKNKAIS